MRGDSFDPVITRFESRTLIPKFYKVCGNTNSIYDFSKKISRILQSSEPIKPS